MVLAGQFLERPALIEAGGLVLEGLFHRGARRPALLVCPPIGAGGGMDAPVVAELAWAAARAGLPSLRFQHRGVGASQGAPDPALGLEDALAALDHLLASLGGPAAGGGAGPVAVAGVAGGAATALEVARARPAAVGGVVLLDPRPPFAPAALAGLAAPALVLLPEAGGPFQVAELSRFGRGGSLRVDRVPGADPGFRGGLTRAGQAAVAWALDRR